MYDIKRLGAEEHRTQKLNRWLLDLPFASFVLFLRAEGIWSKMIKNCTLPNEDMYQHHCVNTT